MLTSGSESDRSRGDREGKLNWVISRIKFDLSTAMDTKSDNRDATILSDLIFLGVLGDQLAVDVLDSEVLASLGSGVTVGSWLYSDSDETKANGLTQVLELLYGNFSVSSSVANTFELNFAT